MEIVELVIEADEKKKFRLGLFIGCVYDAVLLGGLFLVKYFFVDSQRELVVWLVVSGFLLVMMLVLVFIFDRLFEK